MRVLIVWTSLARSSEGGYTFAEGLTRALSESPEVRLILVLPEGTDPSTLTRDAGRVQVIRVRLVTGMVRLLRDLLAVPLWSRRADADLVLVPHEWASWGAGAPVVNVIQNVLYLTRAGRRLHPLRTVLMRAVAKLSAPFAAGSIAVSRSAAESWRSVTGRAATVLPEGVHESFFDSSPDRAPESVVIITGAAPHKNPELAKAVLASLRDRFSNVTLVGLPGPVHEGFVERLDHAELAELFTRTQLVVLTSDTESFGLPAFEARAAGCNVLVPANTAMAEWLADDPHVTSVPNMDVTTWSEACAVALASPGDRRPNHGYAWEFVGPQWVEALRSVTSGRAEAGTESSA